MCWNVKDVGELRFTVGEEPDNVPGVADPLKADLGCESRHPASPDPEVEQIKAVVRQARAVQSLGAAGVGAVHTLIALNRHRSPGIPHRRTRKP